ncbi:hypothetical protein NQZ68_028974 [Dissostichus eleginoides]|nr:hypothetical protein NQZ68_028974 [Dissostichus eleginoides]
MAQRSLKLTVPGLSSPGRPAAALPALMPFLSLQSCSLRTPPPPEPSIKVLHKLKRHRLVLEEEDEEEEGTVGGESKGVRPIVWRHHLRAAREAGHPSLLAHTPLSVQYFQNPSREVAADCGVFSTKAVQLWVTVISCAVQRGCIMVK